MNQEFIGALKEIVKDKGISEDFIIHNNRRCISCCI